MTIITDNSKSPPDAILVDEREAARLLGVCARTLWGLAARQEIPRLKIGTSVRYRRIDLEAYAESKARQALTDAGHAIAV